MKRAIAFYLLLCVPPLLAAQTAAPISAAAHAGVPDAAQREQEIQQLRAELARLSARLDALERSDSGAASPPSGAALSQAAAVSAGPSSSVLSGAAAVSPAPGAASETGAPATPSRPSADAAALGFFRSTTIGFNFDGYYGYNFNQPIGRVNLLRAYAVTSNSFSINQADLVLERVATAESRFGGRLDLMFGQATETLQGSGANEQRPQVWRNVFQAYGSYLAPVGSGLEIDFGKFASALGNEGNYTKDQIAYTRGFLFDYLPFYHTGVRASYSFTPRLNLTYWLVNGAQQTEDFNGFKSQGFLFTLEPAKRVTWNVNYYFGEEARGVEPTPNPGVPTGPIPPGLPTISITPTPNGREHIFDTYARWQTTKNLQMIGEADYVIDRSDAEQAPGKVAIGAFEFQYALPRDWHVGGRAEYFDDRSGLFSGSSQALKEVTVVADHLFAPGFLARAEYRRDLSNQPFFLTDTAGHLVKAQPTATLGLVYWWGTKQGDW